MCVYIAVHAEGLNAAPPEPSCVFRSNLIRAASAGFK